MQTTGNLGLKKPEGTDIVDITDLNSNMDILDSTVNGKVDKVTGKQLSTNDYTTAEKTKLTGIGTGANNYTHPNHTGDVTSAGDGVTAITAGVIVDSDVNAAAGISWTKLNKTGASLADLATRSAGDLTSGTLPAARLPAITGDITMAAGTGTAAITAGAVVNADVNAAAAIDATKIGTGVVSNVEFNYLDGVTSGIQAQLNARPLLTTTPQQTTGNVTYYVRTDGNDSNTGLANTAGGAFKTIQAAVNAIPQIVNHVVVIQVAAGTYPEVVSVAGFTGKNNLSIRGAATATATHMVSGFDIYYNAIYIQIEGFTGTRIDAAPFNLVSTQNVLFSRCIVNSYSASGAYAYNIDNSRGYLFQCVASNRGVAVYAHVNALVFSQETSGTGNVVGHRAYYGGRIHASVSTVSSTNPYETAEGGIVTNGYGAVNPWGDNTLGQRSAMRVSIGTSITAASSVFTKMPFNTVHQDYSGEFNTSLYRFSPKKSGWYLVTAGVNVAPAPAGTGITISIFVNGFRETDLGTAVNSGFAGPINTQGGSVLYLAVGSYVEIYMNPGVNAVTTYTTPVATQFTATQIA